MQITSGVLALKTMNVSTLQCYQDGAHDIHTHGMATYSTRR